MIGRSCFKGIQYNGITTVLHTVYLGSSPSFSINSGFNLRGYSISFRSGNFSSFSSSNINSNSNSNNNKKYVRTNHTSYIKERVSVTKILNNFLIGHYTPADLSMLSDFEDIKYQLDIINKCFVTLKKPILINGINVYVIDTMLIAPGGKKSLDAISLLYKGLNKLKISDSYIRNMNIFIKKDPELFKKYALQDSLIALVHGIFMEEFNHTINGFGIPLTLSSLSGNYVRKF